MAASMGCTAARLCGTQSTPPCRTHLQKLGLPQLFAGASVNLSLGAGLPWAASVNDGERHLHKAVQLSTKYRLQHLWAPILGTSLVFGSKQY